MNRNVHVCAHRCNTQVKFVKMSLIIWLKRSQKKQIFMTQHLIYLSIIYFLCLTTNQRDMQRLKHHRVCSRFHNNRSCLIFCRKTEEEEGFLLCPPTMFSWTALHHEEVERLMSCSSNTTALHQTTDAGTWRVSQKSRLFPWRPRCQNRRAVLMQC